MGENFTTEGLFEDSTRIGDRLAVGTAEFMVTQPRLPCFKFGIRVGNPRAIKTLFESRKTGFYLAVVREGFVRAGDPIRLIRANENRLSITEIVDLYSGSVADRQMLQSATELTVLPLSWRDYFRKRLAAL